MLARKYPMAVIGFGMMLALSTSLLGQQPGGAPPGGMAAPGGAPPQNTSPNPSVRPTIAVFNMVAVLKEYNKARYQVWILTEERKKLSGDLTAKRAEMVKLQQEINLQVKTDVKEQMQSKYRHLALEVEERTRAIDKQLNEKASDILSTLYDEIKTVVDKTAEMNGYHIVFAYPDATSPEDAKSAYMKELKLKPPAAAPFYVAKHVDITGVVIQTLNLWFPSALPPKDAVVPATPSQQPPAGAAPGAGPRP